jgi:hypothetical protein
VHSDEELCKNIVQYAQRFIQYVDVDFAKEMRKKDRPIEKPPERPDSLRDIHPDAMLPATTKIKALAKQMKQGLKRLDKNKNLSSAQRRKAKRKVKKDQLGKIKSLHQHIPSSGRNTKQQFCAVAYVLSPMYQGIDDTQCYGRPALGENDPAPDKVYSETDFDEAIAVHFLQAFETQPECDEFVDNRAKHDLEFGEVVTMEMYVHTPMDHVITNQFRAKVKRTYTTEMLQNLIVDKDKHEKMAAAMAQAEPDSVTEISVGKDGKMEVNEAKRNQEIRADLDRAKGVSDIEYKEFQARVAEEKAAREELGGGAGKDDEVVGIEEVVDVPEVVEGGAGKDGVPEVVEEEEVPEVVEEVPEVVEEEVPEEGVEEVPEVVEEEVPEVVEEEVPEVVEEEEVPEEVVEEEEVV